MVQQQKLTYSPRIEHAQFIPVRVKRFENSAYRFDAAFARDFR